MCCACASAGCWKVSEAPSGALLQPLVDGMVGRLGDLTSVLRAHGSRVGVGELQNAVRCLEVVDVTPREEVRTPLRTVLCPQPADLERFALEFPAGFGDGRVPLAEDPLS